MFVDGLIKVVWEGGFTRSYALKTEVDLAESKKSSYNIPVY